MNSNSRKDFPAEIKEEYNSSILSNIRKYGPISRTELYRMTRFSKSTITRIVEDLIEKRLVKETGILEADSKRKPVGLELNPDIYYCIGINISKNTLRAILADFTMNIIHKKQIDIKKIDNAVFLLELIHTTICDMLKDSGIDEQKILGAGIGIPGIVDHKNGIVVDFASTHKLSDIHVKKYLESKFKFKVFADNDVNTQVLGEYWYGYATNHENSIFVNCREGIGAGIISEGKIIRGKNNVTGEFGHMIINTYGRQCTCGRYGCLEAYSSTEAIENSVKAFVKRGRASMVTAAVNSDIDKINYRTICQSAYEGDKLCLECLKDASNMLSIGLINLIDVLNPEIVILSGDLFDMNDIFFEMVKEFTREKLFNTFSQDVIFMKREINDNLYEIGAAALVYKDFFND